MKEKINKTLKENTAASFQIPFFPLSPHAIPHPRVVSSSLAACSFSSATGSAGDWDQAVVCCSFTAPCFLFNCSPVGFFTSRTPSRVVAPPEFTLILCSGYDFPLAFFLLSRLSFLLLLCWHGFILFSSYCYSTVIFLVIYCPFLNMPLQKCQKLL